jgi:hypothetical protein
MQHFARDLPADSGEELRVHVDAVRQILQPQILVGGVLAVVVVGERYADSGMCRASAKVRIGTLPPGIGRRSTVSPVARSMPATTARTAGASMSAR